MFTFRVVTSLAIVSVFYLVKGKKRQPPRFQGSSNLISVSNHHLLHDTVLLTITGEEECHFLKCIKMVFLTFEDASVTCP